MREWIKKKWFFFAAGLFGVMILFFMYFLKGRDTNRLFTIIKKSRDGFLQQIRKIENLQKEEDEKLAEATAEYKKTALKIEGRNKLALENILTKSREERRKLELEDSKVLASKIKEEFEL